jgi:hypothetical protein
LVWSSDTIGPTVVAVNVVEAPADDDDDGDGDGDEEQADVSAPAATRATAPAASERDSRTGLLVFMA